MHRAILIGHRAQFTQAVVRIGKRVGGRGVSLGIWGCPPVVCVADFDQNGTPSIDDIFIFLNAWFAQDPRCDVDQNAIVSIDDIFIFLNRWFAGC